MSALNSLLKYSSFLLVTLLVLFLIKIFDISYPMSFTVTNTAKTTEFSVVGEGKAEAVPDTIYVDLGISVSNAATAEIAQNKIDEVNNKIIESLRSLGVEKKDIKTGSYNISPGYSYQPNRENKITGYNGSASVIVKLSDAKLASEVIAKATEAGANQINGTRFVVDKPEKYREVARNKAIENAKAQAAKLSGELGISLGKIVNMVESTSGNQPYPIYDKMAASAPAGSEGPALEPGTQEVSSTVTLYFEKK